MFSNILSTWRLGEGIKTLFWHKNPHRYLFDLQPTEIIKNKISISINNNKIQLSKRCQCSETESTRKREEIRGRPLMRGHRFVPTLVNALAKKRGKWRNGSKTVKIRVTSFIDDSWLIIINILLWRIEA